MIEKKKYTKMKLELIKINLKDTIASSGGTGLFEEVWGENDES